jgi:hypothetical protein
MGKLQGVLAVGGLVAGSRKPLEDREGVHSDVRLFNLFQCLFRVQGIVAQEFR